MHNKTKTKKVAGVDLRSSSFAYIGDESDTSTWRVPIYFPGDNEKTVNHINNALARFSETGGIPEGDRASVFLLLCGAARSRGISVKLTQKQFDDLSRQWQAAPALGISCALKKDSAGMPGQQMQFTKGQEKTKK
jgi:hypothetical protein